jgi:hypothetical protein
MPNVGIVVRSLPFSAPQRVSITDPCRRSQSGIDARYVAFAVELFELGLAARRFDLICAIPAQKTVAVLSFFAR